MPPAWDNVRHRRALGSAKRFQTG